MLFQELFYGPYFCQVQDAQYYSYTELIPDGPTTKRMQDLAKQTGHGPRRADVRGGREGLGHLLQHRRGDRRRRDVPRQVPQDPHPARQGLLGEVLLPAGQPRLPGLRDRGRQGRRVHLLRPPLPRGRPRARPQRRRDGASSRAPRRAACREYLWRIEQVSHAVANGYYVGTINRVGIETDLGDDDFYGQSYFVDPRGQFVGDARRRPRRGAASSATWTSTRSPRSARPGSSTATAGPTRTRTSCALRFSRPMRPVRRDLPPADLGRARQRAFAASCRSSFVE